MNRRLRLEILKLYDTQADFAAAVGTHATKVSMVLRGRRKLEINEAKAWLRLLGCEPSIIESVTQQAKQWAVPAPKHQPS